MFEYYNNINKLVEDLQNLVSIWKGRDKFIRTFLKIFCLNKKCFLWL